jgi:hypothetical protein
MVGADRNESGTSDLVVQDQNSRRPETVGQVEPSAAEPTEKGRLSHTVSGGKVDRPARIGRPGVHAKRGIRSESEDDREKEQESACESGKTSHHCRF